ncbi:MAG: cytochrome c [Actinomycetota bacterium]|nr:cytochrome c [Actinomycetota bacterium]
MLSRLPVTLVKISVVLLCMLNLSCGSPITPTVPIGPDGVPDQQLIKGREIWGIHCSSCHGNAGQGGRGKRLNNGEALKSYTSSSEIAGVISEGKGQGMPAFSSKLAQAEIDAVIQYIREVLN